MASQSATPPYERPPVKPPLVFFPQQLIITHSASTGRELACVRARAAGNQIKEREDEERRRLFFSSHINLILEEL